MTLDTGVEEIRHVPDRQIDGAPTWVTTKERLGQSFAARQLLKFNDNPAMVYWKAV